MMTKMKITRRQLRQIIKEELRHASQQDLLTESAEVLGELSELIKHHAKQPGGLKVINWNDPGPSKVWDKLHKMHPRQIAKIPATIAAAVKAAGGQASHAASTARFLMQTVGRSAGFEAGKIAATSAAGKGAAGLTAASAAAAGATAAAVLALFGGVAFATFYPIAQMQKIEGLITKMAQLNGRPVQLSDLDGQTQGRLKEYLAAMIIAMNDKENPSEEARDSFNKLMAKDALPGRKSSSKGIPDIPAHAVIDYKTVESLKPYIRELQQKGKEEAAKMKDEPGVA